jgi:hypothetical protein
MRKAIHVLIVIAFLGLLLGNSILVMAQDPVTASINVPPEVVVGSNFTAMLDISDLLDFDAGQFDVSFDDTVLRLDNVTAGLIGTTEIPVSLWIEMSPGIYLIIVNVPNIPSVTGSGYFAVLHFHVIGTADNSSDITLSKGFINDNLAQEIPATWVGASTTVPASVNALPWILAGVISGSALLGAGGYLLLRRRRAQQIVN